MLKTKIFDLLVDKYRKLQIYCIISHRFVASYLGNNFIVTLFRFDLPFHPICSTMSTKILFRENISSPCFGKHEQRKY